MIRVNNRNIAVLRYQTGLRLLNNPTHIVELHQLSSIKKMDTSLEFKTFSELFIIKHCHALLQKEDRLII